MGVSVASAPPAIMTSHSPVWIERKAKPIECSAEAETIDRVGGMWRVTAGGRTYEAPVLLNAAGSQRGVDRLRVAGGARVGGRLDLVRLRVRPARDDAALEVVEHASQCGS